MARKAQITIYTALKDAGFKKAEKGLKNLRFQAHGLNSSLAKLGVGVGVAEFARKSVDAAVKMEAANAKLGVSLTNIGQASALGGASIKRTSEAMANLGFSGESTASALANLVTITGSLDKAQSLMGLSADAARFLHTDLADAATKLGKAYAGGAKGLLVFGIKLDKTLKPAQAFDKAMGMLNAKISGQAAAYAGTYAGKLEILKAKFEEVQIQVGEKLLPVLVKLGDFMINTGIPRLEQFFTLIANHKDETIAFATAIGTLALSFKSLATYSTLSNKAMLPLLSKFGPLIGLIAVGAGAMPAFLKGMKSWASGIIPGLQNFAGASVGLPTQSAPTGKPSTATKMSAKTGLDPSRNFDRQAYQTQKDLLATQKKTLAQSKSDAAKKLMDQRKIDAEKKLSAQFDLNQIALANALKLNLTAKEKAAVEGLLALEDDGYKTEEQRMVAQEAALRKLISLKGDYASMSWDKGSSLGGGEKQISIPQTASASIAGAVQNIGTNTMVTSMPGLAEAEAAATQAMAGGGTAAASPIVININAPMVTPEVVDQISVGLQNKLRAGGTWYTNAASG